MQSLEIAEEFVLIEKEFKNYGYELIGSKDTIEGKIYLVRKKNK
jgi:hypothetical protein